MPPELAKYSECKVFQSIPGLEVIPGEGPVIVLGEGETLSLSREKFLLLDKGPKYCVVKKCSEEQAECDTETAIIKEKWDRMGRDTENMDETLTDEELKDRDRGAQLAEEVEAQTRLAYDEDTKIWSGASLRVTDYKANSRVILPKALSPVEESKLEVLRVELLHQTKEWIKTNCDSKG